MNSCPQTILVAPLNWGLGHATRLCPIITQYCNEGHTVILAGNGASLDFLKAEFPHLKSLKLRGYSIKYPFGKLFFFALVFLQMPLFGLNFLLDYVHIKRIVRQHGITTIISDNRYGCRNRSVKSILITHQIFIKLPTSIAFIEPALHWLTRQLIARFDECWIPDYAELEKSLSGTLSHGTKLPKNCQYIGPLSRFTPMEPAQQHHNPPPDVLILISGPEPFRTKFTQSMLKRFSASTENICFLLGKPQSDPNGNPAFSSNLTLLNHAKSHEIASLLTTSQYIISIAGYSTIMDLHVLGLTAELIPTPGQTEQEYLVTWLTQNDRIIQPNEQ